MASSSRDQALSLFAAANNHGDVNVKLSSLTQAKDLLLSLDPSLSADLFPFFLELQSSPESLVRKLLIQLIEEIGFKAVDHSPALVSILLTFLRDADPIIVKQSIVSGTNIFCNVFVEMIVQFQQYGKVERWLEGVWMWMLKFKDAVFGIALEPGSAGIKLLGLKFLEIFVLLFTPDNNSPEKSTGEGSRQAANISWLVGGHPLLDPVALKSEANRTIGILLNLLQPGASLPGCLTITVINCLSAIARKRPQHYDTIFSALLDFNPNFQTAKRYHIASVQYSLRTAFLGFLRCTYSPILESRERLIKTLRAMNAADAADQVIRQVDKIIKNGDRSTRDARVIKDDQSSIQSHVSGELSRKRAIPLDNEHLANGHEAISKRIRSGPDPHLTLPVQVNDFGQDLNSVNGVSLNATALDGELTAVEQMIALIGALLAEGERGAESLEILVSKIHPDLLADIVITNMKHLPKTPPPLARIGNSPVPQQVGSQFSQSKVLSPSAPVSSIQSLAVTDQAPFPSTTITATSSSLSDINNLPADSKRDPRRDPRRLDPRRIAATLGGAAGSVGDDIVATKLELDDPVSLIKPSSPPVASAEENNQSEATINLKNEDIISEGPSLSGPDRLTPKTEVLERPGDTQHIAEAIASLDSSVIPSDATDEDRSTVKLLEDTEANETDSLDFDQFSPDVQVASTSEDTCLELPQLPPYVDLTYEQETKVKHLAIRHIIESYRHLDGTGCQQFCMPLLARLVAQIDDDNEFIVMLQNQIVEDHWQKGHELVLYVLYHLHCLTVLDSVENSSSSSVLYEKFLLGVAKSLLESFPASDKSFSRLLGEVPLLPESALNILSDLCCSDVVDHNGKIIRDIERVTQGLGAIWSLILGRPQNRQACLGIALKCAVHPQDEIRAKAIRLVTNKLYQLSYIAEDVEKFATDTLLSAVDHDVSQSGPSEQRPEVEVACQEISGTSQVSESTLSEHDSDRTTKPMAQSLPSISFSEAQRLISLFFALCTKKPSLLQIVFDVYGRAPRMVKQAFHRHIPILLRALGQSYTELLHIISDPPQGSENLLTLVLQILTQDSTPSLELISTVKRLYETKFKDVSILVPLLSSLSKKEVLPIFPRLVDLPLEKFQRALAHILQGSAHTGPALTPVEVLVAIHGIVPEKDGLALKKITDACSACFEQRTVFTQQVLAKALNQMVDQTPLPLLFMRTVIQAIDAFPALVDFVMEILSKLVTKQLPPPQLESALNRHANLRGPLASYANQPAVKSTLPRATLEVLGLASESHVQQHLPTSLHPSDTNSSVQGATLT
ncbi:symplekin isoform X3 [Arachis ipaensis]|uniref:symplekin isoform X3 n=1 Tax=Arachis ipaensis TaxID=130454 RepID=UPI000A2B6C6A|nr:symplekin isoform X3 [Arachis ipaensis]XP_025666863.1 symplekin isoform X3 [Arachis hypogaea]